MREVLSALPAILVIALCLWKIEKLSVRDTEAIQSNLNHLRGLFALVIIIGHSTMSFQSIPLGLVAFSKINTLCVGFFFLMSGYGLAYSVERKENYARTFLWNKLFQIVLHAITVFSVSILVSWIESLILHTPIWNTGINWYLIMQGVFYALFYLIINNVKSDWNVCIFTWLVVIVLSVATMILHLPRVYYISEWCFPMGITIFYFRDKITEKLKYFFSKCVVSILVILGASLGSFIVKDYTIMDVILHNLFCIGFYFFVFIILSLIKIDNSILGYLNSISMELYLYQFVVFAVLQDVYQYYGIAYWSGHYLVSVLLVLLISIGIHVLTRYYKVIGEKLFVR